MSERSGKLNFEIGQDATRADIGQDVGKRSVDGTSALKPNSGSTKSNAKRIKKYLTPSIIRLQQL